MFSRAHAAGQRAALEAFGLEKMAVNWPAVGGSVKRFLVGEPGKFLEQARKGQLFRPGGLIHDTNQMPTWQKALFLGTTVLGGAQAYATGPEHRGSALGGVVGGTLGGMAGAPLGLVGTMAGSGVGARFGEATGSFFDSPRTRPHRKPSWLPSEVTASTAEIPLSRQMGQVTGRPTSL